MSEERPEPMHAELALWLERLKKIDAVLEQPVVSLIELSSEQFLSDPKSLMPSWIAPNATDDRKSPLVHALACSTLQRIWRTHRRYPWMQKSTRTALENLQPNIAAFAENLGKDILAAPRPSTGPDPILGALRDPVFEGFNPFVAEEVFWVLLHSGQNRVTGATGFLCLFTMLWSLMSMQTPERPSAEARSLAASVAAKCLRPLLELQVMFRRRATLYRQIREVCKHLKQLSERSSPHSRWKFACAADRLSRLMLELSSIAVNRDRFEQAAYAISDIAKKIKPLETTSPWAEIREEIRVTLSNLRVVNEANFAESIQLVEQIQSSILDAIKSGDRRLKTNLRKQTPDETDEAYRSRMAGAAREALDRCREALRIVAAAVTCCRAVAAPGEPAFDPRIDTFLANYHTTTVPGHDHEAHIQPACPTTEDAVEWTLARLAQANDDVVEEIDKAISGPVRWCRFVVRQEVAYASAGNDTEFDAADLLSAVAIAERAGSISELEVEDAIAKALRALREDGSWTAGQPIYVTRRVLGVWPSTTDLAWLLTGAIIGKPKIRRGDSAMLSFLDWLERTRTAFDRYLKDQAPGDDDVRTHLVGWSGEARESRTIDYWVTSGAINALLEMRELVEYRLWELCEKRFFVFREVDLKSLDDIDPVDLGAVHERRLHRRLRNTARETSGPNYRKGEYSFVFHGPPGSSKTAMAEALGREMWRETTPDQRRVVRITPADFTRQGEAGVDAEARFIFELLSHVRGVTIIFDEIDDLLSRRALKGHPAFLKMVVPAMLNRLQDLRDAAPRQEICFIIAMNYIDNVEPALTRPGRIDAAIPVVYPDPWSRDNTLDRIISAANPPLTVIDRMRAIIVDRTAGWPWPLFNRLCEAVVAEYKKRTPNRDDLLKLIIDLETQRQDAGALYAEELRWKPVSPELVNEIAHFAMAFERTSDACTVRIRKIIEEAAAGSGRGDWYEAVIKLVVNRLVSEWEREQRAAYNRDAAMRTTAPGATRILDIGQTIFRVWAPTADEVSLVRPAEEVPSGAAETTKLQQEGPGVFSDAIDIRELQRYRFSIATGPDTWDVLDPYGRETDGDVAFTVFDDPPPAVPPYSPLTAWQDRVIYQVHPRTCTTSRTYDGIIERLDHIKALGCNAIDLVGPGEELTWPMTYDPRQRRQEELAYGGISGLRALVRAAHDRQLHVIVGVATHDLLGRPSTDLSRFNGYFPPDMLSVGCGPQPDLTEPRVRNLMTENARRWIEEIGVDGLRWTYTTHLRNTTPLDTDRSPRAKFAFLREMNQAIADLKRDTFMVAVDMKSDDKLVDRQDGALFATQWSAGYARAIRRLLTNDNDMDLDELKRALTRSYYDTSRSEFDAFLRIVFSESNTTVRQHRKLTWELRDKVDARKRAFLATALALVTPGIPMLLQGQEVWNDLPLDSNDTIDWNDNRGAISERLRDIIRLRHNIGERTLGLQGHHARVTARPNDRVIVIDRWLDYRNSSVHEGEPGNHTIAVVNLTPSVRRDVQVTFPRPGTWHVRFNSHSPNAYDDAFGHCDVDPIAYVRDRHHPIAVGAYGMVILSQDRPEQ